MDIYDGDSFMVAWTSDAIAADNIAVGPWPDQSGWSDKYNSTTGCCDTHFQSLDREQKAQTLVGLFADLVLGNGLDPKIIHREFMKIELWRAMMIELPSGRYIAHLKNGDWSPHIP